MIRSDSALKFDNSALMSAQRSNERKFKHPPFPRALQHGFDDNHNSNFPVRVLCFVSEPSNKIVVINLIAIGPDVFDVIEH